ncbi:hypothetical protein H4I96_01822 [Botrytis cinerea]
MTPMLDRAGSDRLDSIHPAAANADGYGFDDDMMRLKVAMRDVPFSPGHDQDHPPRLLPFGKYFVPQ